MKRFRTLISVALMGIAVLPTFASPKQPPSGTAPTQPAQGVKKEITEDEAVKIALKRVPGEKEGVGYTDASNPYRVFVLSKEGKECEVVVDRATGTVKKVLTPRLTKKQAIAIARKKIPGQVMEAASRYHAEDGAHEIYIIAKDGATVSVLVSDKTGRVTKVTRGKGDTG